MFISANGKVVALFAAAGNIARVYEVTNDGTWNQIGHDLERPYAFTMSADGNVIAASFFISGPGITLPGPPVGVFVYQVELL